MHILQFPASAGPAGAGEKQLIKNQGFQHLSTLTTSKNIQKHEYVSCIQIYRSNWGLQSLKRCDSMTSCVYRTMNKNAIGIRMHQPCLKPWSPTGFPKHTTIQNLLLSCQFCWAADVSQSAKGGNLLEPEIFETVPSA